MYRKSVVDKEAHLTHLMRRPMILYEGPSWIWRPSQPLMNFLDFSWKSDAVGVCRLKFEFWQNFFWSCSHLLGMGVWPNHRFWRKNFWNRSKIGVSRSNFMIFHEIWVPLSHAECNKTLKNGPIQNLKSSTWLLMIKLSLCDVLGNVKRNPTSSDVKTRVRAIRNWGTPCHTPCAIKRLKMVRLKLWKVPHNREW